MNIVVGALAIVAAFLVLVAPHEGGHFLTAKAFGVRVLEFSIGMGTRLASTTRGGTLYALRLVPLGGYVRLGGMEAGDYSDPEGFHSRPAWQRLVILAAGPAVNFVLAALLAVAGFMTQLNSDPGRIVGIDPSQPAYAAGMRPGDSILAVDGHAVARPEDIASGEDARHGQPVDFRVRHLDGRTAELSVQPVFNASLNRYVIGIRTQPLFSAGQAVVEGVRFPVIAATGEVQGIWQLASGEIPGGVLGPQGVTGPIGIGEITYGAAQAGLGDFLIVVATLSVALGLANLLPIPALDGGRMVVVLIEKLRGRPFDRDREMAVQRAGLVALLVLFVFIAYFDVERVVTHQFPGLR